MQRNARQSQTIGARQSKVIKDSVQEIAMQDNAKIQRIKTTWTVHASIRADSQFLWCLISFELGSMWPFAPLDPSTRPACGWSGPARIHVGNKVVFCIYSVYSLYSLYYRLRALDQKCYFNTLIETQEDSQTGSPELTLRYLDFPPYSP